MRLKEEPHWDAKEYGAPELPEVNKKHNLNKTDYDKAVKERPFKLPKTRDTTERIVLKGVMLEEIKKFPDLWQGHRGLRNPNRELFYKTAARRVYRRTGKLVEWETIRTFLYKFKHSMVRRLKEAIVTLGLNAEKTEGYMREWPLYTFGRFYRSQIKKLVYDIRMGLTKDEDGNPIVFDVEDDLENVTDGQDVDEMNIDIENIEPEYFNDEELDTVEKDNAQEEDDTPEPEYYEDLDPQEPSTSEQKRARTEDVVVPNLKRAKIEDNTKSQNQKQVPVRSSSNANPTQKVIQPIINESGIQMKQASTRITSNAPAIQQAQGPSNRVREPQVYGSQKVIQTGLQSKEPVPQKGVQKTGSFINSFTPIIKQEPRDDYEDISPETTNGPDSPTHIAPNAPATQQAQGSSNMVWRSQVFGSQKVTQAVIQSEESVRQKAVNTINASGPILKQEPEDYIEDSEPVPPNETPAFISPNAPTTQQTQGPSNIVRKSQDLGSKKTIQSVIQSERPVPQKAVKDYIEDREPVPPTKCSTSITPNAPLTHQTQGSSNMARESRIFEPRKFIQTLIESKGPVPQKVVTNVRTNGIYTPTLIAPNPQATQQAQGSSNMVWRSQVFGSQKVSQAVIQSVPQKTVNAINGSGPIIKQEPEDYIEDREPVPSSKAPALITPSAPTTQQTQGPSSMVRKSQAFGAQKVIQPIINEPGLQGEGFRQIQMDQASTRITPNAPLVHQTQGSSNMARESQVYGSQKTVQPVFQSKTSVPQKVVQKTGSFINSFTPVIKEEPRDDIEDREPVPPTRASTLIAQNAPLTHHKDHHKETQGSSNMARGFPVIQVIQTVIQSTRSVPQMAVQKAVNIKVEPRDDYEDISPDTTNGPDSPTHIAPNAPATQQAQSSSNMVWRSQVFGSQKTSRAGIQSAPQKTVHSSTLIIKEEPRDGIEDINPIPSNGSDTHSSLSGGPTNVLSQVAATILHDAQVQARILLGVPVGSQIPIESMKQEDFMALFDHRLVQKAKEMIAAERFETMRLVKTFYLRIALWKIVFPVLCPNPTVEQRMSDAPTLDDIMLLAAVTTHMNPSENEQIRIEMWKEVLAVEKGYERFADIV